jgi:hypothetical protein
MFIASGELPVNDMDEFPIAKFTCEPNVQYKRPVPVAEKSLPAGKKAGEFLKRDRKSSISAGNLQIHR